jgi:hypothetical protein
VCRIGQKWGLAAFMYRIGQKWGLAAFMCRIGQKWGLAAFMYRIGQKWDLAAFMCRIAQKWGLAAFMCRIGQNRTCYILYINRIYMCVYDDFPAENTVSTPHIYGSGQPYVCGYATCLLSTGLCYLKRRDALLLGKAHNFCTNAPVEKGTMWGKSSSLGMD